VIAAAVAVALALVAADGVVAQTPPVTLTVSPVEMTLAPGERGTGELLVENQSSAAVVLDRVTATAASPSVRLDVGRLRAHRLAPGASSVIAYTATRLREGYGHDVGLSFTVGYESGSNRGAAIRGDDGRHTAAAADRPGPGRQRLVHQPVQAR
jgi:hypothetical protein